MSDVGGSARFEVDVDLSALQGAGRSARDTLQGLLLGLGRGSDKLDTDLASLTRRLRTLAGIDSGGARTSILGRLGRDAVALGQDLDALIGRTRAFQRQFANQGLDPDLLRLQTNQLTKLVDLQRRTQADMVRIASDPQVRRAYQLEFDEIARVVTREGQQLVSLQRDNNAERARLAREGARERANAETLGLVEARRASRVEVEQARAAANRIGAATQAAGQLAVTQARASGQARVAITRGVVDTIGRLERGLGAIVAGTARTIAGATARVFDGTVGSVQRSFQRRHQIISGGLRNETRLFSQQSIQIQRIQEQANRGLIGSVRTGGLLGGLGAGLGIGALGNLGFQRAADIENVQKRLNVLLNNNVFASRALFLQLAAFARTTAFDLTGVSDLASRLLAVGVNVDQILPNIKALSGAITLVGGSTDDLNGIARAIGQIGSLGKLTAEEMNQISERLPGINLVDLFTKSLGFESSAAFLAAREAGEITADVAIDAFFRAMRFDPRFASALEAGANSFSNLRANALEAFADIGAAFFERLEAPIKAGLRGTITAFAGLASFIRGGEMSGQLELLRVVLAKVGIALLGVIAAKGAVEVFQLLGKGIQAILTPAGLLGLALTAAGGAFLFFFQRSERFREIVLDLRDRVVAFGRALATNVVQRLRDFARFIQPVTDRLREFGSRIIGIFDAVRQAFRSGGLSAALRTLLGGLAALGREALRIFDPLRERIVETLSNLGDVGLRIRDRIVESLRSIDFGAILGRLGEIINTNLGRIGVGAVAGGVIAGPLGAALGAAFGLAVNFAIPRLRQALQGINVMDLFGRFLEGVRQVARRIGEILTDRRTLIAVGAIAAAAAAIAAQFVRGFAEGVISNLPEIAGLGADLFKAMFEQNSVVKAILALVILFRSQLFSALSPVFRKSGQQSGQQLAQGVEEGVTRANLAGRIRAKLQAAGAAAGNALATGIAGALAGSALGSASSGTEQLLGLGSLGAAVATAASINPALGVATAGVGLLTTAISANARASQEARDRILGFKEAIEETGSVAGGLGAELSGNLSDTFGSLQGVLADVGFNVRDFQEAFATGRAEEFIDDVRQRVLETSGSIVNATAVTELLERAISDVGAAAEAADLENALTGDGIGEGFRRLSEFASGVRDRIRDAIQAARDLNQQQRAQALEETLTRLRNRAQEIGDKANESRTKLQQLLAPPQTAADATAQTVTNVGGLGAQLTEGLELSKGVQSALGNAQVQQAIQQFGLDVSTQISQALTEANPGQSLQDSVAQTRLAIVQSPELSPEAKQAFIDELDRQFGIAQTKIPLGAEVNAQEAQAAGLNALAQATQAALTAGGLTLTSATDILSAVESGQITAATAQAIVTATPTIVAAIPNINMANVAGGQIASTAASTVAANPPTVGDNLRVNTGPAFQAGLDIAAGLRSGISAGTAQVAKQAAEAVDRAIIAARAAAGAASPSKVFMGLGKDLMMGLAIGIRDNSDDVVSAIQEIVDKIADPSSPLARGMREGISSLFSTSFERARIFGGGNRAQAISGITTAFRGILSAVESNASALFSAGAKKPEERTLSDRLLLGESFTSLRPGDEFGVANRNAIQQSVEAVMQLGEAMLEQGFSAQTTANELDNYRSALIQTAIQAGLSTAEVVRFVDQLGLSPQAINNFINQVGRLNAVVAEGRRQAGQPQSPVLTPGVNPVTDFFAFEEGAVQISVPDGADGEFVALTTVNAIAQAVRR